MDRKRMCMGLRWEFSAAGLVLLLYYGLISLLVFLAIHLLRVDGAWGYLAAVLLFAGLLRFLPGGRLLHLWEPAKPMGFSVLIKLLGLVLFSQWLFQLSTLVTVPLMDENAQKILSNATSTGDTLPMFLYSCLAAPIFEEILFRGIVQQAFLPYGRSFSILCSGILFGVFHANPIQMPFAFAIGLVLGYVALEYSLGWAVVLHLLNNLVLGGIVSNITPSWLGQLIYFILLWGGGIMSACMLVKRRADIATYLRNNAINLAYIKAFITSPGIVLLFVILMGNMVLLMM